MLHESTKALYDTYTAVRYITIILRRRNVMCGCVSKKSPASRDVLDVLGVTERCIMKVEMDVNFFFYYLCHRIILDDWAGVRIIRR